MATTIEWTQEKWNPTTGCTHFSKWGECDNCYAEVITNIRKDNPNIEKYRAGFDTLVEHPHTLNEPYKWKKPTTVFVNSMSDLFHKDVSLEFIKKVFAVMNDTPQHTYQILTKRDKILEKYSSELNWTDNIWMGVSVGAQGATRRIPSLQKCHAKHKFLSVEPLLTEINELDLDGIDWVIVGGESGPGARPLKQDWVEKIQDICQQSNTPFFFKQWGENKWNPNQEDPTIHKLHKYHSKGGSQLNGKTYWSNPTIEDFTLPEIKLFNSDYYVMDKVDDLVTIWELKSLLPFVEDEVFKELKADIRKNGLIDPVLYWITPNGDKLIIEGHTRIRAYVDLKKNNIPSKEIKADFQNLDDIKLWMIKHQMQRRNLSNAEKVQYAYNFKDTIEEKAKQNLSKAGKGEQVDGIDTYSEIAKIAGVGRTTVVRYNEILSKAPDSIIKRLHAGKITIGSAHNQVKDRKPKQAKPIDLESPQPLFIDSIEEGLAMINNGTIENILITKESDFKSILKSNSINPKTAILNQKNFD